MSSLIISSYLADEIWEKDRDGLNRSLWLRSLGSGVRAAPRDRKVAQGVRVYQISVCLIHTHMLTTPFVLHVFP